jgi:hypothetical protein
MHSKNSTKGKNKGHHSQKKFTKNQSMFWQLIDYLLFYVPLKNFSLIWRRHHYRWKGVKFRLMLSAQGLWAGRDLYCAIHVPDVTRFLGFSGLIRRTAPFSRLLRHTRGYGGSILAQILTGSLKKKSSPEPAEQFQSNLLQIILGWRRFKIVKIKSQVLFQGEIITVTQLQNGVGSFKNLHKNHWGRRTHIYLNVFLHNVDSSLFKLCSLGVGRDHNRENNIYLCLSWKNILHNQQTKFN